MNDNTRCKLEKFEREWAFMDKNAVRADLQALIDGFDNADAPNAVGTTLGAV